METGSIPCSNDNSITSTGIEQGIELTEGTKLYDSSPLLETKKDTFLPSVGIVMGATNDSSDISPLDNKTNSSYVDSERLSSVIDMISIKNSNAPEIHVNEDDSKAYTSSNLKYNRKLSRSSSDIDNIPENKETNLDPNLIFVAGERHLEKRSNSEQDMTLSISQSQSESALKNKLVNLTSPVANVTKDLVLNPFTKLAKGVQNLGSNLDPRKFSMGNTRQVTERELEEHRQMQEKWRNSKTRLIAL